MPSRITLLLCAALLAHAPVPAIAAVTNASPSGFLLTIKSTLRTSPKTTFTKLQQVGSWWNGEHTYSGKAAALTLEMRAGGCFCERWDSNSIEHGRVLYVEREKALRIHGALGPLQEMAVNGIMHFALEKAGDDTALTFTYRVRGSPDAALDKVAPVVDRVMTEQLTRLVRFVETGAPVAVAPPPPLLDQFFSSNGLRLRYVEAGAGADPVVLLHDSGSSIEEQWIATGIMPSLVRQDIFRVIALDLRGHGRSEKPQQPGVDAEMALDVERLMSHLNIRRAHVVGYGLGANIAAKLATLHPGRFITMTLAGGAHVREGGGGDRQDLAVTDEQMRMVPVPTLGLIGTRDPALRELLQLKSVMPRLVRMVSLEDFTHESAPRDPEFVLAIQYFLRYHPGSLLK
jgi:hypothetical protein